MNKDIVSRLRAATGRITILHCYVRQSSILAVMQSSCSHQRPIIKESYASHQADVFTGVEFS